MGRPPSRGAKPNQSEFRQNPQLADRTTKPQLSIQTISNARTTVTSMFNEHFSTCQFQAKQGKNQDMHKCTWLCNTTPNEQDLQNGIEKNYFWTDQWVRCAFIRILIILDWLRQNVIDKTPPTSKQKQLVCWRTGGKIFLDRPPSKRKLWQNISRSPTKRWSSSANALPATSVWSLKCKMKLRWKSMKRFLKKCWTFNPFKALWPSSTIRIPDSRFNCSATLTCHSVPTWVPLCQDRVPIWLPAASGLGNQTTLCLQVPSSLYSSKSGLPMLWRPADCT